MKEGLDTTWVQMGFSNVFDSRRFKLLFLSKDLKTSLLLRGLGKHGLKSSVSLYTSQRPTP